MKKLFLLGFIIPSYLFQPNQLSAFQNDPAREKHIADSLFGISQWKSAIPYYESYLKSVTPDALSLNRLGYCYQETGILAGAEKEYQSALTYNPGAFLKQVIFSRMARLYSVQNKPDQSYSALEKALELGYSNVEEMNGEDFKMIRNDSRFVAALKKAQDNAFPCETNTHAREFDFWIGEWNVYVTGTDNLVGHSKIEKASGGCMILENWTAIGGTPHNGKSMNFIDPHTDKWNQVWVGSAGINEQNIEHFTDGVFRDNVMQFRYEMQSGDKHSLIRFRFFNVDENTVRQLKETSSDNGDNYTVNYDFTYKRIK